LEIRASEFGESNVLVRVYDEYNTDVVDDFCQLIGLHSAQLKKPARDAESMNTRLTPLASEIMRKARALNIDPKSIDLMKNVLKETSFVLINQNKQSGVRTFTKEFLDNIRAVYQEDTRRLVKTFPATESITEDSPISSPTTVDGDTHIPEQAVQQLIADLVTLVENNYPLTWFLFLR